MLLKSALTECALRPEDAHRMSVSDRGSIDWAQSVHDCCQPRRLVVPKTMTKRSCYASGTKKHSSSSRRYRIVRSFHLDTNAMRSRQDGGVVEQIVSRGLDAAQMQ